MTAPLPPESPDRERDIQRAEQLARWTDRRFLDPVIGFVLPGAGDLVGALIGLHIVRIAAKHRLPKSTIARMLLNLSIDCLGGAVPVVGDLFDIVYRANVKNAELLRRGAGPNSSGIRDWVVMSGAVVVFIAALGIPIWLLAKVIGAVVG
ncbi:MAG TPA: DUF4112 domain-containing protein [Polyangia bacterium]|jgi:hypothetical protein|nr:DUF4112 domain-containing protein [Polyangia bacterium]